MGGPMLGSNANHYAKIKGGTLFLKFSHKASYKCAKIC